MNKTREKSITPPPSSSIGSSSSILIFIKCLIESMDVVKSWKIRERRFSQGRSSLKTLKILLSSSSSHKKKHPIPTANKAKENGKTKPCNKYFMIRNYLAFIYSTKVYLKYSLNMLRISFSFFSIQWLPNMRRLNS